MMRSFVYRAFVLCIVRSFRVSCVRSFAFSYSSFVSFRSFVRVSCVRFVYRAFVSCIVRFSNRLCEAFVRFLFVSFAVFVRLRLVRIVSIYDPGSVSSYNSW
jgi:hypothetical protein